jgi:hypothetical protein
MNPVRNLNENKYMNTTITVAFNIKLLVLANRNF